MRAPKLLKPATAAAVFIAVSTLIVAQRPDPSSPSAKDFGIVGGNYFNRGVAVGDGKVFAPGYDATLLALDQQTGKLVWCTELQQQGGPAFSNAAAIYYDGLVYMGVAGGEAGARGQFGAYDAKTGK